MKRAIFIIIALLFVHSVGARELFSINDDWRLFPASKSSGDDALTISLPHCWECDPSIPASLTNANYLRSIFAPESWRDQRVFIKFYGVQSVADLFVNGKFVGEHRGGSTAFSFEITDNLNIGEDNAIVMRVSSAAQNDVLPTSVEHAIYGGIYRDIELIVTPKVAISPVFYGSDGIFVTTTSVSDGKVEGEVEVKIISPDVVERALELEVTDMRGEVCYATSLSKVRVSGDCSVKIPFSTKRLEAWSPQSPTLYNVNVRLAPLAGDDVNSGDNVSIVTGFRTLELPETEATNRALKINGTPHLMRGVTLYHDHPMEGSVMSDKIYRSDMRIIREMGANAIRSAITPHDKSLYSLCDREGVVAWVDTPLSRSTFFSDVAYFPTARFEANGLQQMREVIYQNYNHPSVVMWGVFSLLSNRGDSSLEYVRKLNKLAKSIDTTRPTVSLSNQNGDINEVTDMIVWLQNIGWEIGALSDIELWRNLIHSRWAYLRSGVMFGEKGVTYHQIERSQIPMCRAEKRRGWYPEERQSEMHEEYMKSLAADSLFWGVWSPAMFDYRSPRSDIGESATGLVTFDRATRKDAYYLYRALWNKDLPTLHIVDKRGRVISDSLLSLRVYASDILPPTVYVNNTQRVMRSVAPSQFVLDSVKVEGSTKIVVKQGNLADSVVFMQGSPLKAREN